MNKAFIAKCLSKSELLKNPSLVDELKSEISIGRKITHPNLARFHETHETDSHVYLVYECINGYSLKSLPDALGSSPSFIAKIIYALLETMDYVLKSGIRVKKLALEDIFFKKNPLLFGEGGSAMPLSNVKILGLAADPVEQGVEAGGKEISIGTDGASFIEMENISTANAIDCPGMGVIRSLGMILQSYIVRSRQNVPGKVSEIKEEIGENPTDGVENGSGVGDGNSKIYMGELSQVSWEEKAVNYQAKKLLQSMLHPEPSNRISIEEALEHEFFKLTVKRFANSGGKNYKIEIIQNTLNNSFYSVEEDSQQGTGKFFEMFIMSDKLNQEIFGYEDIKDDQEFQIETNCEVKKTLVE